MKRLHSVLVIAALAGMVSLPGCAEEEEKDVINIEAPGVDIEVKETPDGEAKIDINTNE